MTEFDISKTYNKYAQDVVDGNIVAGKYIIKACERYISFFNNPDYYFDYEDVDRKIRFVSKMKHSTGVFNNKPFILYNWQQWIFAATFGFKHKDTGLRVTKKILLLISRKNGKSSLAAALALCMLLCDNEAAAEVSVLANSGKQANELFKKIKNYSESIDPHYKLFAKYRNSIKVPLTKSQVVVHSSDTKSLDGYNTSVALIDEFHMQQNWDLYNVMISSMAMRTQPLMMVLTTAGFLVGEEFPLYNLTSTCKDILDGKKTDDTQFAAIYQLDDNDDIYNSMNWTKCSPGYPEIVRDDYMREQILAIQNNPSLEVGVKTKNFNIFCQSEVTWIPADVIKKYSKKIDIDELIKDKEAEYYCYAGTDLSYVDDFTSLSYMFKVDGIFYFKTYLYIPEGVLKTSKNRALYNDWVKHGYMKVLPYTERMTYDTLVEDVIALDKKIPIMELGFDPKNAPEFARGVREAGIICTSYGQKMGTFNMPTKSFEAKLYNGQIIIDDNPAVRWCFANVMLKIDNKDTNNVKPVKGFGKANKIDAVISMLEAHGLYLRREEPTYGVDSVPLE